MKNTFPGLVEICTVYNHLDAEIAKGILEENDIQAFIRKDDCGGMEPQLQITEGIKILVNSQDKDKALSIIEYTTKVTKEHSSPEVAILTWNCKQCGEELEEQFTACWNCSTLRS
ncbi:DUF2007 domain-containing protein [bacterium]|nr:DUF2007 domain-containing protein [bacterium]